MKYYPKRYTHWLMPALSAVFLLCTAMTCDDYHPYDRVCKLDNESADTLYVVERSYSGIKQQPSLYALFMNRAPRHFLVISPKSSCMGMVCPSSEEDVAATRYQVLVFRQTTLARFSTEQLIKENRCDTILDYSYVELEAMDFKITYHDK